MDGGIGVAELVIVAVLLIILLPLFGVLLLVTVLAVVRAVGCSSSVAYNGEPERTPESGLVYSLCAEIELERKSRRNALSVRAYDFGPDESKLGRLPGIAEVDI